MRKRSRKPIFTQDPRRRMHLLIICAPLVWAAGWSWGQLWQAPDLKDPFADWYFYVLLGVGLVSLSGLLVCFFEATDGQEPPTSQEAEAQDQSS